MSVKDLTQNQMNLKTDAGERHPLGGVQYVPPGQQPYDLNVNNAFYHLGQASFGFFQVRKDDANATTIRVMPGRAVIDGVLLVYAGGAIDLAAFNNDTAYVWLYNNGGAAAIGTGTDAAGWPATSHIKLAEVTLASGTFEESNILDRRIEAVMIVGGSSADTGTTASTFTVDSDSSAAKIALDTNSATGNFTLRLSPANLTANRRWTFADVDDTVVGLAATQTLTNKTLSAPTITGTVAVGGATLSGNLNFGGGRATNAADPSAGSDLATKSYVDGLVEGLNGKGTVKAMADANVASLSGTTTIDGVALADGDLVLLTAQTTATQNGAWIVRAGAWERPANFDAGTDAASAFWFVQQGTTYADTRWWCTNNSGSAVVGTDNLTISQFSGLSEITAGTGLTKTGNTLNLDAATTGEIGGVLKAAVDADITNNSGGTPSGTIPALTNIDTLTNSTGGTADNTLEAMADVSIDSVDAAKRADVNARLAAIRNNFTELYDEQTKQRTLNTNVINAIASLATEINDLRAKLRTAGILST